MEECSDRTSVIAVDSAEPPNCGVCGKVLVGFGTLLGVPIWGHETMTECCEGDDPGRYPCAMAAIEADMKLPPDELKRG